MRYLISTDVQMADNAGYKAKKDVINILTDYTALYIPSKLRLINSIKYLTIGLKKILSPIKDGDEVVVQFPLEGFYPLSVMWMKALYKQLSRRKAYIITVIHDLDGLRYQDERKKRNDVTILNYSDSIIVHSESMKQWLEDAGVVTNMIVLELFDYLSDIKSNQSVKNNGKIVFAGNLNKSQFLKLETLFDLDVFGPCDFINQLPQNVFYQGSVNPEKLIQYISKYRFGLVWDGNSLGEVSGNTGKYLRFNAPHKFSLYLAAGVPVITWKEAAIAKTIEKYDLGITISSLNELQNKLNQLTDEQYDKIKKNVINMQEKVLNGSCISDALRKAGQLK